MTTLWQDVVYGFRMLLKKPGFTAIAAFSLALGIGANTAIFSLVNTVLLSSLAYRDPSRLVMIETTPPGHPETSEPATVPDYIAWKEQSRSFESVGAADVDARDFGVSENGMAPERLEGEGFRVTRVDVGHDAAEVLSRLKPDIAFNALHGRFGEDGIMQGVLEMLRLTRGDAPRPQSLRRRWHGRNRQARRPPLAVR